MVKYRFPCVCSFKIVISFPIFTTNIDIDEEVAQFCHGMFVKYTLCSFIVHLSRSFHCPIVFNNSIIKKWIELPSAHWLLFKINLMIQSHLKYQYSLLICWIVSIESKFLIKKLTLLGELASKIYADIDELNNRNSVKWIISNCNVSVSDLSLFLYLLRLISLWE